MVTDGEIPLNLEKIGFIREFLAFRRLSKQSRQRFTFLWKDRYPCLKDKVAQHDIEPHYTYHPAWAVRIIAHIKPVVHIDISSALSFCTMLSAFVPVKFYDYRPAKIKLDNMTSEAADLQHLPFDDGSIASLSCMHVVEHIGLGRYGDRLDPNGDLKAISELKRVLSPGGSLLFVVPVGVPKIMFNAHRIYSFDQIAEYFSDLEMKEFSLITEDNNRGGLIRRATKEMADRETYGCGCFWFKKTS
jgi:SAM-dependent methyltransferase